MNHSHHPLNLSASVPALALPSLLPSVFDYEDYHAFLRDWIQARKAHRPSYSLQLLANRAGIKSRSFLRLVCRGERGLGPEVACGLGAAMRLDPDEKRRFLELVAKSKGQRHTIFSDAAVNARVDVDCRSPATKHPDACGAPKSRKACTLDQIEVTCKIPIALGLAEFVELRQRVAAFQAELARWVGAAAMKKGSSSPHHLQFGIPAHDHGFAAREQEVGADSRHPGEGLARGVAKAIVKTRLDQGVVGGGSA